MARARSKVLVIDTSIARAAGPEESRHPTSKHCRDFLLAVRSICHRVAMTPELRAEWNANQSGFSRAWLVSMYARKKVEVVDAAADESLRSAIVGTARSAKKEAALRKDLLLVEAALASDRRVASLDEVVRALLKTATATCRELKSIVWVNPERSEELAIEWLAEGAPADRSRPLTE